MVAVSLLMGATSMTVVQARPVIMIDPGHGGDQPGVTVGEILEKDLVLRAAFALGEAFVRRGYDVRLARTGDYAVGTADRRAMAEDAQAALMVSLHFMGDEDLNAHGIEIYADLDATRSAAAAAEVATALRTLETPVVVEARTWEFLRSPTVPTIMIEAGFLTHPVERRLIMSGAYQRELAERIVDGTEAFLERGG
jgi:N-acetylmuramoyl-L-alanine amidase